MKFKLDENLGSRTAHLFSEAGHGVETVFKEGLSGASDELIFETCFLENRCLVSLDLDFAASCVFHHTKPLGSPFSVCRKARPCAFWRSS